MVVSHLDAHLYAAGPMHGRRMQPAPVHIGWDGSAPWHSRQATVGNPADAGGLMLGAHNLTSLPGTTTCLCRYMNWLTPAAVGGQGDASCYGYRYCLS